MSSNNKKANKTKVDQVPLEETKVNAKGAKPKSPAPPQKRGKIESAPEQL